MCSLAIYPIQPTPGEIWKKKSPIKTARRVGARHSEEGQAHSLTISSRSLGGGDRCVCGNDRLNQGPYKKQHYNTPKQALLVSPLHNPPQACLVVSYPTTDTLHDNKTASKLASGHPEKNNDGARASANKSELRRV